MRAQASAPGRALLLVASSRARPVILEAGFSRRRLAAAVEAHFVVVALAV